MRLSRKDFIAFADELAESQSRIEMAPKGAKKTNQLKGFERALESVIQILRTSNQLFDEDRFRDRVGGGS